MRSIDPVIKPKIAEASPTPDIVLLEGGGCRCGADRVWNIGNLRNT
jgi:hypothetical protein